MVAFAFPVDLDTIYADVVTDASVALHQQLHDQMGAVFNKMDQGFLAPAANTVLAWNGSLWIPTLLGTAFATVGNVVAYLNATGQDYVIKINPTTGVWPNSGARVYQPTGAALTGFTGRVRWDGLDWPDPTQPAGMINGDVIDDRVTI